jgi:RNA polymerase sigma factor (sigma-70 family)
MEPFADAFPDLFVRARTLALRILGDVGEAEDAAAEAMARCLRQWRQVGDLPYRDAWVLRVTANVAIDVARRRRRSPVAYTEEVPDTVGALDIENALLRSALLSALCRLPRRQREAIVLVHLVGLPSTEVAACMRVSPSSVATHMRRGLANLREQLSENPSDVLGRVEGITG